MGTMALHPNRPDDTTWASMWAVMVILACLSMLSVILWGCSGGT